MVTKVKEENEGALKELEQKLKKEEGRSRDLVVQTAKLEGDLKMERLLIVKFLFFFFNSSS